MLKNIFRPEPYLIVLIVSQVIDGLLKYSSQDQHYSNTKFGIAIVIFIAALTPSLVGSFVKKSWTRIAWFSIAVLGHVYLIYVSKISFLLAQWRAYLDPTLPVDLKEPLTIVLISSSIYLLFFLAAAASVIRLSTAISALR